MAIGMAWSWTFTLVLGWYFVGTQMTRSSIKKALVRATRYLQIPYKDAGEVSFRMRRVDSIKDLSYELNAPLAQRNETALNEEDFWLWRKFVVAGDEERPGPLFNYARAHTWQRIAAIIIDAHDSERRVDDVPNDEQDILAECNLVNWHERLHHFSRHTTQENNDAGPGSPHSSKPTHPPGGAFICWFMAMSFHLLIILPAFWVAYLTPTKGLGCRSGGYLLYFSASSVSALLLDRSAWLSKRWFWHHLYVQSDSVSTLSTWWFKFIKFLAVATRLAGKGLAYANSVWIVLHCIFQAIGWYERCYCNCNYIAMGVEGFWTLLDAQQLQNDTNVGDYWKGFISMSIIVMIGASAAILVLSRQYKEKNH